MQPKLCYVYIIVYRNFFFLQLFYLTVSYFYLHFWQLIWIAMVVFSLIMLIVLQTKIRTISRLFLFFSNHSAYIYCSFERSRRKKTKMFSWETSFLLFSTKWLSKYPVPQTPNPSPSWPTPGVKNFWLRTCTFFPFLNGWQSSEYVSVLVTA